MAERFGQSLKDELERIQGLHARPTERAARVAAIEEPWQSELPQLRAAKSKGKLSESEWLATINSNIEKSGLHFEDRLVKAFHTSLKVAEWAPLTVLGGVSGTGKSELPRLYSRFGGLAFMPVPVQPGWDSPSSLFGFFNSVDNRFDATPLLRALAQSQRAGDEKYPGFNDRVLLVLLDEMNVAHVEQYFSDLLSGLEQRRGEEQAPHLDVGLGAGMKPYELKLGRNVLWTGTMNEDETTKSLSDKVLDRANLLHFPRPKSFGRVARRT